MHEEQRLRRADRQRAVGAGRDFDQPLALRVIGVLTYLRLHVPQTVVAMLFGLTQSDISRDLRRLMPLLGAVLPCPAVWQVVEDDQPVRDLSQVTLEQLTDGGPWWMPPSSASHAPGITKPASSTILAKRKRSR